MPINKFAENVLKPWDELNLLLSERSVFQPDVSRPIRYAGTLAVAIRHLPEVFSSNAKEASEIEVDALSNCLACQTIRDVADAWKHKSLKDLRRSNSLSVVAQFEHENSKFRFIRNAVQIEHVSLGMADYATTTRDAIRYWIGRQLLNVRWDGEIREGDVEFHDDAFLFFDPKHQPVLSKGNVQIFRRGPAGYEACDPPDVRLRLIERT